LGYVFPWKTIDAAHTANDRAWKVLKAEYEKALSKAGIKPRFELVKNHDLRHAFASTVVEQGVPIAQLSKVLGHSSSGYTTERYVHMDNEVAQDLVMKKINKTYVK
jgi:site-specific recombinase XerD